MATCPNGHETAATDFCDVCGMRVGPAASGPDPHVREATAEPGQPARICPTCGTEQTGRFCETCGLDLTTAAAAPGPPAAAAQGSVAAPGARRSWTAVATADREYFDSIQAAGGPDAASIEFPAYCPPRLFRLTGAEVRIGRRSASRGIEPEIDLTGPPTDAGISHLHAVLTAEPDGSWSLLDPGSANGTQLNGTDIATNVRVPLHPGDRICLGGWTALTIQAS